MATTHDAATLLRLLEQSGLVADAAPTRIRVTRAERAASEARPATRQPTIARFPNWQSLKDAVYRLGLTRHEPAIPLLERLWRGCDIPPIQREAGYALRAIGTSAARDILRSTIDESDHLAARLAVAVEFDEDPRSAYDRLAKHFTDDALAGPTGEAVASEALGTFVPSSYSKAEGHRFTEASAPQWFRDDPRWMDLCIRLRRHTAVGHVARQALKFADATTVQRAIERALANEVTKIIVPRSSSTGDLLARYERGEHESVWRDIRTLGPIAGDLRIEVEAVASKTMQRVLRATKIVSQRLAADGWTSLNARLLERDPHVLHVPPTQADAASIARIESAIGTNVPLSLRAFWTIVGGVDFVWDYECDEEVPDLGVELPLYECDPLSISPPTLSDYRVDEWLEEKRECHPEIADPLEIELAADYLHKANISGGAPYVISVPTESLDPVLENESSHLPFTDYLRLCFRWGGFPRLVGYADRADVKDFVKRMTAGLEPF